MDNVEHDRMLRIGIIIMIIFIGWIVKAEEAAKKTYFKEIDFFEKDKASQDAKSALLKSQKIKPCCGDNMSDEEFKNLVSGVKKEKNREEDFKKGIQKKLFFFISIHSELSQRAINTALEYAKANKDVFVEGYFLDELSKETGQWLRDRQRWFEGINGYFVIKNEASMKTAEKYLLNNDKTRTEVDIPAWVFIRENMKDQSKTQVGIVYGLMEDLKKYHHLIF